MHNRFFTYHFLYNFLSNFSFFFGTFYLFLFCFTTVSKYHQLFQIRFNFTFSSDDL